MYLACRHIKPNGIRCKSPALRGKTFCYFHARVHAASEMTPTSDVRLPLPEDRASIQQSLSIVFDALLCSRIDNKKAAQLLWGLQIASGTIPRDSHPDPETVESFTRAKNGEELAPVCRICSELDDCDECKYARTCPKYDGTEWVEVEDEESDDEEETDEEESDDEESGSDLDNKENGSNEPGN